MQIIWRFFNSFLEATGAVICHISHRVNKSRCRWEAERRSRRVVLAKVQVQLQTAKTNNSILPNPCHPFHSHERPLQTLTLTPFLGGGAKRPWLRGRDRHTPNTLTRPRTRNDPLHFQLLAAFN